MLREQISLIFDQECKVVVLMTNVIDSYDYSFNVLHEQVAEIDLFEDKTHENVATTLNKLMSQERHGLTIGLEGSWGSGKSTVINILRKQLIEDDKNVFFFAFDAWAHDGDPLRKIFLESLIDSIEPNNEDKKLIELKNQVSARKKTVTVNSEKSASKLGKYLSTVAILVPAGAALLNQTPYDTLVWPFQELATSPSFRFIFGLLFAFGPLLMIGWWWFWGEKDAQGKTKWDFFESESIENYTQDITEDGERTSIEFERFFNEIMSYLLSPASEYNYEQAVIVIDNLDRVDPEYAQTIWSTLQTFFQHRNSSLNHKSVGWKDKLWFVIPFDREAIQKIWEKDADAVKDNSLEGDSSKKNIVATSFMEKSFQITVEVPPSVMSAWIDYLKQCVSRSLNGWPDIFKLEYIESYVRCMSNLGSSPSPRRIHNTINRAGILALHWKDEFSAESLCIYSLARQSMTENEFRIALLKEGIPKSFPVIHKESKIKPELAGLLFGVSADKGIQLLLAPEIKSSISEGNGEKLYKLKESHKDAFWLALRVSENAWMIQDKTSDDYIIKIITALHDAFINETDKIHEYVSRIETTIIRCFKDLNLESYSYVEALEKLLKLSSNEEELVQDLNKNLKLKMSKLVKLIDDEKFSRSELLNLSEIESLLLKFDSSMKHSRYGFNYENWKKWVIECLLADTVIKTVLPTTKIYEQIVANCGFNSPQIQKDCVEVLGVSLYLDSNISRWSTLVDSVIGWLNLRNRTVDGEPVYKLIINMMPMLRESDKSNLKKSIKGAEFWQRSSHSAIENNPTLPLLVAVLDDGYVKNAQVPDSIKQYLSNELEKDRLDWVLATFRKASSLDIIWELAKNDGNTFAVQLLEMNDDADLFSCDARYFDEIKWSSESVLEEVILKLCKNGAIKDMHENIIEEPNLYHRTINLLTKYGNEEAKKFSISVLNNLNKEQWLEAFENNNDLLLCVKDDNPTFSMAWANYLKNIASGASAEIDHETFTFFWSLKNKVLDLKLHLKEISMSYFQYHNIDSFNEKDFMLISSSIEPYIKCVDQIDLERKLSSWIESNHVEKIKWFLNIPINFGNAHYETLIAQVKNKILSSEGDELYLYEEINEKLELDIDSSKP